MMMMMPIMRMVRGGNMTRGKEGLSSCFVTAERATVGAQEEPSSSSLSSLSKNNINTQYRDQLTGF